MRFLYVHIPFCVKKCNYCDFVSGKSSPKERRDYIELLKKEASLYQDERPEDGLLTIYFGGGTPSLLSVAQIEELLAAFKEYFGFASSMEITLEANPESVSRRYLKQLKRSGVNRLSFGVQSFQNHHLKAMGRLHRSEDAIKAVNDAADIGFENINIDLIYGLPAQTLEEWRESLEKAVSLPVKHISTYGLKLSEKTVWGKLAAEGRLTLPDQDDNADMQLFAMDFLEENGFPRYEIANFAVPGYPCRHNTAYWLRKDYLGLGLNASSLFAGKVRAVNESDFALYRQKIKNASLPRASREKLSKDEIREEELFLPLRTIWGLDIAAFSRKYGSDFFAQKKGQMVKLFNAGLLVFEDGQLKLTKKGVLLNNEVLSTFI